MCAHNFYAYFFDLLNRGLGDRLGFFEGKIIPIVKIRTIQSPDKIEKTNDI